MVWRYLIVLQSAPISTSSGTFAMNLNSDCKPNLKPPAYRQQTVSLMSPAEPPQRAQVNKDRAPPAGKSRTGLDFCRNMKQCDQSRCFPGVIKDMSALLFDRSLCNVH